MVDLDKLRSINANTKARGTSKKVVKDPVTGGHEVHHWDDRVDAVVRARPVDVKLAVKEED